MAVCVINPSSTTPASTSTSSALPISSSLSSSSSPKRRSSAGPGQVQPKRATLRSTPSVTWIAVARATPTHLAPNRSSSNARGRDGQSKNDNTSSCRCDNENSSSSNSCGSYKKRGDVFCYSDCSSSSSSNNSDGNWLKGADFTRYGPRGKFRRHLG